MYYVTSHWEFSSIISTGLFFVHIWMEKLKAGFFWTFAKKLKVKKLKLKLKKLKTQEMFRPKLKILAIFSEIQEDFYPNITIFI